MGVLKLNQVSFVDNSGLLDKVNGIPGHQFFLIALYLIFAALYPIMYLIAVSQSNPTAREEQLAQENPAGGEDGGSKKDF